MRISASPEQTLTLRTYLEIAKFADEVAAREGDFTDRTIAKMTRFAYLVMLLNDLGGNVVREVEKAFTDEAKA